MAKKAKKQAAEDGAAATATVEAEQPPLPEWATTPTGEVDAVERERWLGRLRDIGDDSRKQEILDMGRRWEMANQVAQYRNQIAHDVHRLEDGVTKLDFKSRPFLIDIYADACLDRVLYGSAQFGKTEWMICDMAAMAMLGLKVLVVISKNDKRDRFAQGRLDPCFGTVEAYKLAIENARERNAKTDNTRLKAFGPGSINLIAATAKRDFTSYAADASLIDEHQECDQDNIRLVDDRMSASLYRFITRIGHPTFDGTEENGNLDFLYRNSDRRSWKVPCTTCGEFQKLDWWNHVIHEVRNRQGGIVSVRVRDEEWRPGSKLDIRPVCRFCHRPMNRLTSAGKWFIENPNCDRHGYKLSNLYNRARRLDELYERYYGARYRPNDMAEFVNKQLGESWTLQGGKMTDHILEMCSDGEATGMAPYRFFHAQNLSWTREGNWKETA